MRKKRLGFHWQWARFPHLNVVSFDLLANVSIFSYISFLLSVMVSSVRKEFNEQFSQKNYNAFLKDLDDLYPGAIEFRLAETPVFVTEQNSPQN
jgi:hypothetical protein